MEFESAKEIRRNDIIHCFNRSDLVKMKTLLSTSVTNIRGQFAKRRDDEDKEWLKLAQRRLHGYRELICLCDTQMKLIKEQKKNHLQFEQAFIEIAQERLPKELFKEILKLAREQAEQARLDNIYNSIFENS